MISALPFRTAVLEERFWAKVEKTPGCWNWTASTCGNGYGQFFVRKDSKRPYMALAHRVAYELLIGAIPEGMTLDHLCKNVRCVNPSHLEVVSRGENVRRGVPKNRRKTKCPKGHEYDYIEYWTERATGERKFGRRCSVCRREQERRRISRG